MYVIVPLICATTYGVLAIIALLRPTKARITFAMYLTMATLWSLSSATAHLGLDHQQTYSWSKVIMIAGNAMIIFYYHFVRRFANKRIDVWTYVGYFIAAVIAVLGATGFILRDAYFADGELHMFYVAHATNLLILLNSGYMIAAIVILIRHYRSSIDNVNRNRTIYLLMGIAAFAIIGMTKSVPALFMYPLDYVGGAINALLIAYAILRYQLLDVKFVLRKGLVYSTLTVLITVSYLFLMFILQTSYSNLVGSGRLLLAVILAVLIAILFNPFRNFIQDWIDRVFYRQTYDYRQMLLHFSDRVSNVLDLNELAQSILDPIVTGMHVKQAALLFPEVASGDFTTRFSRQSNGDETPAKLRFTSDNPIVTWLNVEGKALRQKLVDILPQFKGLWEVEKTALNVLGVELLCPIRSKGKLIGILSLGKKQSDSPYTDEEVSLLTTMANEAGVVVENASMLDSLKAQQLQVEQLLAQVVLAQEEERNRISIDLHDSVAQWLVGASYRLQTFDRIISGDEKARCELADMEQTVTKSLKELRRVVVGLRPPALDELGLTHALRQGLEELKADNLDCQFSVTGTPFRLPSSMEIAIYRVVQETLSNIRKHAQASKVNLRLQFQEDKLRVEIRDNGKGFDLNQTLDSAIAVGHMGLLGMKKRIDMLGGNITIKTSEGAGTSIIFSLPVQSTREEK